MDEQEESVRWRAFAVPKAGSGEDEYEDAFACSSEGGDGGPFRAAVADGATEAVFTRQWAQLLAEAFAERGDAVLGDALAALQDEWAAAVEQRAGTLPWYAAEKAEAGAFAALLGLEIRPGEEDDDERVWEAVSVGDCNVLHLRGERLVEAWPRTRADDFDDRPALVPSRPGAAFPNARRASGEDRVRGTCRAGDAFVLCTDAAAAWLLDTGPAEGLRWNDEAAFAEAVRSARAGGRLKNDDTTVLIVEGC